MTELPMIDPGPPPPLSESRNRVLEILRTARRPMGVQDIAGRTGLHANTARFHLDGLVEAGLAARDTEERDQPGRPRMVYRAVAADATAGLRSYRMLAEMLIGVVLGGLPQPERAAVETGEKWGRYLADRPAPLQHIDAAEGVRRTVKVLESIGFAPEPPPEGITGTDEAVIRIGHCPFRELAEQHREVVCSLHLGLMRGVLSEVRAPITAERLEPFVEPSLCLARLAPASGGRP
ncbi:helix-turn-helix domain-containing protein [Streptomyces sp. HUCO-GS316]|uniref:helix-turn-helix transcriptional regulator n=1 Tax=Streptomyces sp. HUCO-GS316 TaxID=2692198 RepID=UPI00137208B8|nr:helix-turn-helix domain-containing protein [Streptomyces sp. HUCO-GS316]MXM64578.1 helix-turn-helix domain-containing protein [Streptomyces sp. HUCO-GS316]